MIITRTPLRISFIGGGTDLPAFYRRETGMVVSTAIDKYIYLTVNKKFDHRVRASYSVTEIVESVDEIKHELIRESLKLLALDGGIEITSISDIPSQGTGLGSSSTYTVGLLNALHTYRGEYADEHRLAREACQIELDRCSKPIGKQDQYIAAFGGLKCIQFNPDETVYVDPIVCSSETKRRLEESLLLLYTGKTRSADAILSEQARRTASDNGTAALARKLGELAQDLRWALCANQSDIVGELMHNAWETKKQMAPGITSEEIDWWYDRARARGAIGGKILGAGGGGFLLLYAPLSHHEHITRALPELRRVPFRFEPQGSKIIYVEEPSSDFRTHGVEAVTTRVQAHSTAATGAFPYV
jgi:D-glycero-alpha-D-manno-heptose-7-phosphate kinase